MEKTAMVDLLKKAEMMSYACNQICILLDRIVQTDNKEEVEILIDAMQFLDDRVSAVHGLTKTSIKQSIKDGEGDLAEIREKCVKLEIV